MSMKREKIWQKVTSAVLSCVFGLSISFVAPVTTVAKPVSETAVLSPDSISVPAGSGSVYKTYTAPAGNKLVIHIQDAHCNPGVQHNICNILKELNNNNNIQLVGIEGAKGWVNTAILNAIPNRAVRENITKGMVEESIIDGATEFAGNQEEINAALYGVESKELYLNNLKAYKEVAGTKKDALAQVELIKGALDNLQGSVLNETLSKFITAKSDYNSNNISYNDYVSALADIASSNSIALEKYPNIAIMERSFGLEKDIDFDLVDKERTELIDLLSEKMDKEKLEELVTKSLQLRTGKMEGTDYYTYLCELIPKDKEYPNLVKYADYVKITAKLNKKDLTNEKIELENELTNLLAKTQEEKTFVDLTQGIYLAEKLFNIKLTRSEFNSYSDVSEQPFLAFIKEQAPKYNVDFSWDRVNANAWEECQKASLVFYNEALKREDAFVENLVKQMDTDNLSIATLITGGFHTEKIEEILASKGVSYVVVRPTVTERAEEGVYSNIMNGLADSMLGHTLAPAGIDEPTRGAALVTRLVDEGLVADAAAAEAMLKARADELKECTTVDEVVAKIRGDRADFMATIYANVPKEGFEADVEANAVYGRFVAAIDKWAADKKVGEVDYREGDVGLAHWNIKNSRIEVSINALRVFAKIVLESEKQGGAFTAMPITYQNMLDFINVVLEHERNHSLTPDDNSLEREIAINALDALKLKALDLNKLIDLFEGKYINEGLGIRYTADQDYANFLKGIRDSEVEQYQTLATTLVNAKTNVDALAVIKGLKTEGTVGVGTFYDGELFLDVARVKSVDLTTGRGEYQSTAGLSDGHRAFMASRGFASAVAEDGIGVKDVFGAINAIKLLGLGVGSATRYDGSNGPLNAFITQHPKEKQRRLILTSYTNSRVENVKRSVVLANLAVREELGRSFEKQTVPCVQQYELELVKAMNKEEREAFVRMLRAVKEVGKDKVHYQFLDTNGQVVTVPDEDLKDLQTAGEVKDATYMVILNPEGKAETQWRKKDSKFLPVRAVYDAVPVLASTVAGNSELLDSGQGFEQLPALTRDLFRAFFNIKEDLIPASTVSAIFNNPWLPIVSAILANMPIEPQDWKAIDLMRRMIAVAA